MKEENKRKIETHWNMIEAFSRGIATADDKEVWDSVCDVSNFRTSFSYYASVDATYIGMLDNCQYFTNNCSPSGLIDYITFFEKQLGIPWKEIYMSNINSHVKRDRGYREDNAWWIDHLKCFG